MLIGSVMVVPLKHPGSILDRGPFDIEHLAAAYRLDLARVLSRAEHKAAAAYRYDLARVLARVVHILLLVGSPMV